MSDPISPADPLAPTTVVQWVCRAKAARLALLEQAIDPSPYASAAATLALADALRANPQLLRARAAAVRRQKALLR